MATSFPGGLDAYTNPTASDTLDSPDHAAQHANVNDAVEALEAKVGIDGSAVTSSHDYKLSTITGSDKVVGVSATQTLTNKTLTSPVLNTPRIGTSLNDTNGNEIIETPATASAVNHLSITNSVTGSDPLLSPAGDDTNVGIKIKGKGTGKVKVGDAELEIPDTDGSDGEVLTTNGAGVLNFTAVSSMTIESTDGTTHSLTTNGAQTVVVLAMGYHVLASSANETVNLKYDGTTKDSVVIDIGSTFASQIIPFSLMYTEVPASQTANITVDSDAGTPTGVRIIVFKI